MKLFIICLLCICSYFSNAQYFQRYFNFDLTTPKLRDEVFNSGLKSVANYDSIPDSTFFCSVGTSFFNRTFGKAQFSNRLRFVKTSKEGNSVAFNNGYEFFDKNIGNTTTYHASGNSIAEIKNSKGNGGYIIVGAVADNLATNAKIRGGSDAMFARINSNGTLSKAVTIDFGNSADTAWCVKRSDFLPGTFIVCGHSIDSITKNVSCFVARFLPNTGFIWGGTYNFDATSANGVSAISFARSFCEDPKTGNIYVAGTHQDRFTTSNDINGLVFSLNSDGNLLWSNIYKLAPDDQFESIKFTNDNELVICGHSNFSPVGAKTMINMLLLKVKAINGGIIWQRLLRASGSNQSIQFNSKAYDLVERKSGGITQYYVVGPVYTNTGISQLMYRVNGSGVGVNNYKYNTMKIDSLFGVDLDTASKTPGVVIFSSIIDPAGSNSFGHLQKTTFTGATCINSCNVDSPINISIQMIVQPIPPFRNQSMSTFGIATKKIAYQTKLQCSQIAPICPKIGGRTEIPTSLFQSSKTKMSIYPNPVVDKLMINTDESNKLFSVRLLNLFGQIVWKGALNGNTQIDMKYLPKGMYTLQINSAEGNTFNRIIKQ